MKTNWKMRRKRSDRILNIGIHLEKVEKHDQEGDDPKKGRRLGRRREINYIGYSHKTL